MAGGNQHKNNFKNNYFEQGIQRAGENFIQTKNPRELQSDSIRVFRDIVRGRMDVRDYVKYFSDPQFLESCIVGATQKLSLHTISSMGVQLLVEQCRQNDEMTLAVLNYHTKAAEGYSLISQGLQAFKTTGQIDYMMPFIGQLRNYRDYI